jgi:hypothetical protein
VFVSLTKSSPEAANQQIKQAKLEYTSFSWWWEKKQNRKGKLTPIFMLCASQWKRPNTTRVYIVSSWMLHVHIQCIKCTRPPLFHSHPSSLANGNGTIAKCVTQICDAFEHSAHFSIIINIHIIAIINESLLFYRSGFWLYTLFCTAQISKTEVPTNTHTLAHKKRLINQIQIASV